ncbi:MAG: tetratricopeptide repeat protein [Rhizomicrobium sp.]|jgi:tetratricopeptide (TPR) repeat protein
MERKAVATDALERGDEARLRKRPSDARQAFADAARLYREMGSTAELAHALTRQAQIERDEHRFDEALQFQLEALALQRTLGDRKVLAHVLRHVADILQAGGRHPEADPYYAQVLEIYRSEPDVPPLEFANTLRSMALHREHLADKDGARRLWSEARDRYAALDATFLALTGQAGNPGVREADARLAALSR